MLISQLVAVAAILLVSPGPPAALSVAETARAIATGEGPLVRAASRRRPPEVAPAERAAAALAARELAARLGVPPRSVVVDLAPEQRGRWVELVSPGEPEVLEAALVGPFRVHVLEDDGLWIEYRPARRPLGSWEMELAALFLLGALLTLPVALWFARALARPFAALAREAERIGRNPHAAPGEVGGPAEAQTVGRALAQMQERLAVQAQEQTRMLAAIAHDMRTPLARLAFRAEALPEAARAALTADLAEMEAMLASVIGFGRDTSETGPRERLELVSLVEQVADGAAVTACRPAVRTDGPILVEGDAVALRRAFANLVGNALAHGGTAEILLSQAGDRAVVEVRDDGPGMAEADLERAFEPFFRARSTGRAAPPGSGLGLAVVRAIVRAHGGEVRLSNRAGGGLSATVFLPLAGDAAPLSPAPGRAAPSPPA